MRLILIMTLAGLFAANSSNANRRLETVFENPRVADKSMPATFLVDGKFTLQLFVSIQPVGDGAVRRRTVLTNRRRTNRKEIRGNVKERLKFEGHETIVRTQVTKKNQMANEGRLKTTTSGYPTSKSSEESDDLPWESWKTKNGTVKGSIRPVTNRTTSFPIPRPRLSRMRTTPAHSSKDARRTHFVIEQRYGNSPEKPRGEQNRDQGPMVVNDTVFKLRKEDKDADVIDWRIVQVQTDGPLNSDPINSKKDHFREEPQTEVPIVKHSVVGRGSAVDQATPATEIVSSSTVTVVLKLPLPFNQPIARESLAFDVTADTEGQVFPTWQMVIKETRRDSTATDNPVSKSSEIAIPLYHRKLIANESESLEGIMTETNADRLPVTEILTSVDGKQAGSSNDNPIVGITHIDILSSKLPTPINRSVSHVNESDQLEERSIEVEHKASEKQMISDRVSTVKVRRPSWRDYQQHGLYWVRYVDEEDDFPLERERIVNPINLQKKKVVIVNRNRDERGTSDQLRRSDTYLKKESPYFYYHYDTSNALATGSCYLPLLIASLLLLFCYDTIALSNVYVLQLRDSCRRW